MSTLKDALPRTESELGRNRSLHGDKSYYYAHNEGWQVPEDAVVRAGPGLVVGGAPQRLGPNGQPLNGYKAAAGSLSDVDIEMEAEIAGLRAMVDELERQVVQQRSGTRTLTQFSFSDEGAKCKVYVEVGSEIMERKEVAEDTVAHAEAAVTVSFSIRRCVLRVWAPKADGSMAERRAVTFCCESDVVPEKCTYKVDRTKGRVTIALKKVSELKKWQNVTTQAM
mmetsp:Transcript_37621/g.84867  ORF Transcript_37621/g.84867 Transcript_37621/m.84867 type:complete len:224 (-) Transcript_37621:102-773(-)